jgi:Ca2+:H+ antiporter
MALLLREIRDTPVLWLLVFVPAVFAAEATAPAGAHTLLFVLSVLAIVPLATLLSHATESVAAKTGDAAGGLLNATLGNLTELVIALTALRAGQYTLVKASIAGAIVTNTLFMLGMSFLLGGLVHHVQEYNLRSARLQASLLFLATIALLVPSAVPAGDAQAAPFLGALSVSLSVLLIAAYGLGMLFSLGTHRELFGSVEHADEGETPWPIRTALGTLAVVTVVVALVSEVFVESVQGAAESFGMTPAFVGFIVVALVGAAAEMASAFAAARKDRLDLSVGIALGSAAQIALFVAPVLVLLSYVLGPTPMDLQFWPGSVAMMLIATLTATLVTNGGRSAWFVGVLVLMVYLIFAMTLYLLPPRLS